MKKTKPTFIGGIIGALAGLLIRPLAIVVYSVPHLDKMADLTTTDIITGLIPSSFVGLMAGAISGSFSKPKFSSLLGAILSGGAFAAWSNGPFELWVINIRFQWPIFIYFTIAGAIFGLLGGVAGQLRNKSKNKAEPAH
jgi:hypothetical protein